MSSVTLKDAQSTRDADKNDKSRHSVAVKVSTSRTSNLVLTTTERIEANSSQSNGNSRVSSRRFSRTHVVRVGDLHASNFSGMDSSGVISTWGLSSPGVDLLATYLDKHRVSSVDLFNTIPTHSDFSRGIGDRDSFIEVSHLGADKAQMKEEGNHESPAGSGQDSSEIFAKETLADDAKADEVDGTGEEVTTSRTVHLSITHVSSLSRKVMR